MKASHFVPRMRSAIMRAIGAAIVLSGLAMLVSPDTYAQQMVEIQLPHAKKIMNDGSVKVTIHLLAPALPSSLRVEGNDVDISAKFYTASCGAAPCEISAKLDGNIVQPGWNYLRATIEGPNASSDEVSAQFYNPHGTGATDATTGYAPPFAVHVAATSSQGLEVDYKPGLGNVPHFYPDPDTARCLSGQLTLLTLNRSTLAPISITCYGTTDNTKLSTYLKTLTKNQIVFASTFSAPSAPSALGKLDLSPIGGTNFAAANAPEVYGYSVIGYGASSNSGLAVESYKPTIDGPLNGVQGDLINLGSTTPVYGFRSSDSPAFTIQPGNGAGEDPKITIGYVTAFPVGEGSTPSNWKLPANFKVATYTMPACVAYCGGGFFVAVFDSYTLAVLDRKAYATNGGISAQEITRMTNELNGLEAATPRIVMITTFGDPFGKASSAPQAKYWPTEGLVAAIQRFGVSGYALNQLITGGSFSMVGYVGATPAPNQGLHSLGKWYSSTAEPGESGRLRGLLLRDNRFLYRPQDVAAFIVDPSTTNPTTSQLLAFAIASQLARAPSVNWPAMDTDGRREAYAYASNEMNISDYYAGAECRLTKDQCDDIRYRYTGSQLNNIVTGIDPRSISYPQSRSDPGFTQEDLTAVANQLADEKQYLKNASSYASLLKEINTNALQNIGLSLQNSATATSASMYAVSSSANSSGLYLTTNILNITSAAIGAVGPAFPPATVISGLLGAAGGIVALANSAQGAPDPEVTKLADLLAQHNGAASQYAYNFNLQVQSSTGTFFNGVYSDWFKLQAVGLMTVTPNSGWYYDTVGNALTQFNREFAVNARTSFFQQIVPQYFTEIRLPKIPNSYYLAKGMTQQALDNWAADYNAGYLSRLLVRSYSWTRRATPGSPRCTDYVYMVTKASVKNGVKVPSYYGNVETWPSSFGDILMGTADPSNPNGNLAMPQNFFYDTSGYPVVFTGKNIQPIKGECGVQ